MEDVFALVGDYFRVQTKPPVFQLRTVGPMSLSIVSSVSIIICSKALMSTHGFIFATTLTSWLLLVTFCSLHVALRMGLFDHKPLDSSIVILFGVLNGITIGVLNLNLCVNSVGFYQMTKLAIFACTVILKALFFRKKLSRNIQLSLSVLLLGVGVATVTDLQLNAMGSVLSLLAIIATSIVQIHTSTIQKSFRVSTTQLLYQSCPYQALTLFVVGPFLNLSLTNKNVFAFEYTPQVRFFIVLLCLISFSVNFNTIHLIGKTSPLTYQVTGHLETCLVLAFGHVLLQDPFSWINKLGNLIAMVGMGLYFHFCNELYQRKPTEVSATMVMASNRVKLLYKGHQILNVIFGILIGLIAVLRWCKGRAEFDRTAIQTFLVNFSMIVLVCVLPQSLIRGYFLSKKGRGVCLEAYIWTGAMVLHDYVALLMINIQYIRIVMIPGMILILIGTLGWKLRKSRTVEVGSSEKNHDGVNTMKMEDTNNEEILFVEKTNSSDKLELFEVGSSEKNHDGVNTMKMEDTNNEEILFVEKTNSSDKLELFEVGSSEKNHDGVNTMKMEDTNNEEILFVEKTNSSDKLELFEVGSSEKNHDGVNTMKMEDTNNEEILFVEKTNSSDKLELFEVGSSEKNHDGVNTMKMEDTNNEGILFVEKTNSIDKLELFEVGSSEKNHDGVNTMKMEDTNNEGILFVEKTNSSDKLELFEVGSSEKNHDGVNTMKMEDTNNEEILFVEKTNSSDKLELFEVGSSEKNHDGVNTMKMEDTNNEEILFVEKTNSSDKLELFEFVSYLLQLSLVTWTQYKGQQGCTPVLSDFLLFFCSALGALGVMLASPLAGVNFRAVSKEVLPVLHKTCAVALFIAVHTLAAEWLGEDMAYVCLPELITVLAWFTICVGESMSVSNFTSHRSKLIMVSSVVAILAGLISLNANDSNMQINLIMWSFRISLSSSAFSLFHVWLLHDWPGSSSESSILIRLLKVASIVGSSTAAILCAYMMVTDPMIMYEAISSFEHKAIAAVVPIILHTLIVLSAPCRPGQPEMKAELKEAHAEVHRLKEKAEKETCNVMPSVSMREPEEWGPMKALVDDEDMETSDDRQGWAWTFDDEEIVEDDMAMCNNTPRLRWTWTSKDEEIDE